MEIILGLISGLVGFVLGSWYENPHNDDLYDDYQNLQEYLNRLQANYDFKLKHYSKQKKETK